jgi:hypothetical protein
MRFCLFETTDPQKLIKRWEAVDLAFNERKETAEDLQWVLKRSYLERWDCKTMQEFRDRIELAIVEARRKEVETAEANLAPTAIKNDTLYRLKHGLDVVIKIDDGGHEADWFAYLADRLAALQLTQAEARIDLCTRIQIELEKIKKTVGVKKPDWGKAADLLMPMFQHLFLNGIKHDILSNAREQGEFAKAIKEFGEDIDCVMTEDDKDKLGW